MLIYDHIIVTAGYFWCAVPDQLKLGYEHIKYSDVDEQKGLFKV